MVSNLHAAICLLVCKEKARLGVEGVGLEELCVVDGNGLWGKGE